MKADSTHLVRLLGTLATVWALAAGAVSAAEAPPADTRPFDGPIQVQSLDGKPATLADFRQRVTVVNFWASWCFPCRYEMPGLQKIHDRYKAQGLTVIAVAMEDELDAVRAFQEQYGFSFPILFDADGSARKAFHATTVPQTFVVGPEGTLVPFKDPRTGRVSTIIDDPTVWEGPEITGFLDTLTAR